MKLWQERVQSAIGPLVIVTSDRELCSLDYQGYEERMHRLLRKRWGEVELHERPDASPALRAVHRYFSGELRAFESVSICFNGTDFQRRVWRELIRIPPGATASYHTIAKAIGKPGGSRAVGMANGSNPIALAIPCHRVIAANGALGGYAGGVEKKEWLLNHERKWA